jgi:hypothetical protein
MQREPLPPNIERLLTVAVESPERLEVLLLLRRNRPKTFTSRTVGRELYVTPASAERDLALLCGRGFLSVTIGNDLLYSYKPVTAELEASVDRLLAIYDERKADVLAALQDRQAHDPVRAFADAFKLRKEGDDG